MFPYQQFVIILENARILFLFLGRESFAKLSLFLF